MSTLVNKSTFSPSMNKKGTPKKTHPNKENLLASTTGTPTLTASNGKLKGQFKIFNDNITTSGSGKKGKNPKRRSLAPLQPTVDDDNVLTGRDSIAECPEGEISKPTTVVNEKLEKKDDSLVQEALDLLKETEEDEETEPSSVQEDVAAPVAERTPTEPPTDTLVADALALMKATEKVDDSYWKNLAEERRVALEETLDENDKLYDEIDRLKLENDELRKELSEVSCYKVLYLSQKEGASDSGTNEAQE